MSIENRSPQLQSLLADVALRVVDLLQREFQLFRAETRAGLTRLGYAAALLIVAAGFLIAGIVLAAEAAVEALAVQLESEAMAAAAVSGACLILALLLFLWGRSKLAHGDVLPRRSMSSLRRDAEMLAEKVS